MDNEKRSDLRISGAGSTSGGSFNEVRISGAGKVTGDVDCNSLNISGASEIKGNVKAVTVKINGASQIRGNLSSREIEINGSSSIDGNVETVKIKVQGGSEVGGNLHAEEVEIKGAMKIKGDCEADNFKNLGGFNIQGLLSADNIYISMGGDCKAREIGGEKIEVRRSDKGFFALQKVFKDIFNIKDRLITESIEGDDIYLESTDAKVVRGKNVTIGHDCNIALVEYKEHISISQDAQVGEQKKI